MTSRALVSLAIVAAVSVPAAAAPAHADTSSTVGETCTTAVVPIDTISRELQAAQRANRTHSYTLETTTWGTVSISKSGVRATSGGETHGMLSVDKRRSVHEEIQNIDADGSLVNDLKMTFIRNTSWFQDTVVGAKQRLTDAGLGETRLAVARLSAKVYVFGDSLAKELAVVAPHVNADATTVSACAPSGERVYTITVDASPAFPFRVDGRTVTSGETLTILGTVSRYGSLVDVRTVYSDAIQWTSVYTAKTVPTVKAPW